jgi:alkanesulfonate monooxygenase SsuD/methylene tetrahydromethanopterin reductase-like flavin-dependent oxidoreductase (luciferase family)
MTTCVVGADRAEVRRRLRDQGEDPDASLRDNSGALVGTADEVVAQLQELEDAGVDRVMLQHLAHDDLDMVELIGREIVPRVR